VQYDGLLEVLDPARLNEAVANGIGSGKGFGFGLLSLGARDWIEWFMRGGDYFVAWRCCASTGTPRNNRSG